MQKNQAISNNKIIFFVVFVCAAIMASLFVFRMSHQNTQALADSNSVVFPVARDIKNFDLVSSDGSKLTQAVFKHHWTLLFFGFTHCSSICPATLDLLSHVYTQLKSTYPNLQVVFISLDPARDDIDTLAQYTHRYHADFISGTGKLQEIRKLQSQLGIYSASTTDSDQIQHTPSILLINPEGKWSGVFTQGMSADKFVSTFNNSMKLISQQTTHG